jgi:hypothetical protein
MINFCYNVVKHCVRRRHKERTPNEEEIEMNDPNTSIPLLPALDLSNPYLLPAVIGALLALALIAVIWGILTMKLAHHKATVATSGRASSFDGGPHLCGGPAAVR